ncbi:terminase large subunit domain-containing protein [Dyadobacter sp. CY343]|uniref:terminase large subunit domain-containing protein n=1 Tax=Dyadobacter sp. CY343 TaxID=2907299 RepID=UPI001F352E3D|nr:terminase family protein [Dyadobacter sp. CY343]MCE7061268.1 terminase family protein [Dyadobacter sp. CY343]
MSSASDLIQEVEVNDKQADFIETIFYGLTADGTKTASLIGGIGSGKTFAMALAMILSKEELPRAKGQFACATVTQFTRSIFPGIKSTWSDSFGLRQYNFKTGTGDYVFGRKPPEDWDKPYQEPENWENCISFPNGWVMEVCAYKMFADIHRGRNDDFAFMDEALLFKREWLKILEGRIRANKSKFQSPLHWMIMIFSSPPYGQGDWMFDIEDLMREEPDRYLFTQITTRDNAIFLPSNYIDNLRKKLTPLEFGVEVDGKRLSKMPKSFYAALDERHSDVDQDVFYNPSMPIAASIDFNAHFTSCSVWQDYDKEQRCIMSCFVTDPDPDKDMSQTLAGELLIRLADHPNKTLYITGDRNGLNASSGSKKNNDGTWITLFDEFAQVFEQAGWVVFLSPLTYNPFKDEIYLMMKDILAETREDGLHVRFHPYDAKSVTVSMQRAPMTGNYQKDKKSENKKDEDQQYATHLSDTVDYYLAWKLATGGMAVTSSDGGFDLDFI